MSTKTVTSSSSTHWPVRRRSTSGPQPLNGGGTNGGGNGDSIRAGEDTAEFPVPVAHWRFEDNALDWAGESDGTEKGGVVLCRQTKRVRALRATRFP